MAEFLTLERNTYRPVRALEVQLPHLYSDFYFSVFPITLSFIHSRPATLASLLLVRLIKHIHPHTRALILAHFIWYIFFFLMSCLIPSLPSDLCLNFTFSECVSFVTYTKWILYSISYAAYYHYFRHTHKHTLTHKKRIDRKTDKYIENLSQ